MSGNMKSWLVPAAVSFMLFFTLLPTADREHVSFFAARVSGDIRSSSEKKLIEQTIKDYNHIITDFYASGGIHSMLDLLPATTQVKHEIFRDLGYIKSSDMILVYDLAEVKPFRIALTAPGRAEGQFYEAWNYIYQKPDRTPITRPNGFGRGVRYQLVKGKKGWQVEDWDPDATVPDLSTKEFKS